jgi:hypothetical protein
MTPEERIAQLEAELARERARADGLQEIVHALTVKRRSPGAERQARYRARHSDVTSDAASPPPLPSLPPPSPSPSLPAPISPPPISSPNPSLSPPFSPPATRNELRLEPQAAARRTRAKAKPPSDPRHHPLVQAVAETGYTLLPEDFAHVAELLRLADQSADTRGVGAHAEVLRRWAIGRAWRWANGEAPVQSLRSLRARWNECKSEETAPATRPTRGGPAPPSDFSRPSVPHVQPRSEFAPEVSDEPF